MEPKDLVELVTQIVALAAVVSAMTPNKSDNKIVDFALKFVNLLGANVGKAKNSGD